MRIMQILVVLIGIVASAETFVQAAHLDIPQVKVKTTLTLEGRNSEVLLKSVAGTLTLMNPRGREKLAQMGNTFEYQISPTSTAKRTIELPALSHQSELFEMLAAGLVFQHDFHRLHVGSVVDLNLRVRRQAVDSADLPGQVGVLTLGSEIHTNMIEGHILEGSLILSFSRLSNRTPSERTIEFNESDFSALVQRNDNFNAFQKPDAVVYFVPDTDHSIVSVVLPIGRNAKGQILFVDKMEFARALQKGGVIKVFADSKKYVQRMPTAEFESLLLGVGQLSVDSIFFDTAAIFEMAQMVQGKIDATEQQVEYYWRGMQMVRLLASEGRLIPALDADELLLLKCSSVFWTK